jgi:hypothetical protein
MSRPVLIVRESLIAGPLVALLVAGAAAIDGDTTLEHWLTLLGMLVIPLSLFVAAARLTRRLIGELVPASRRSLFVGVTAWVVLSFPVHAVLGLVLKATTHHRALGGATMGALALAANLAAALLGWRLSVTLGRRGGMVAGMLNTCLALSIGVIAFLAARAAMAARSGWLLAGLVAVASTVLAARWDAPRKPDPDPQQPI